MAEFTIHSVVYDDHIFLGRLKRSDVSLAFVKRGVCSILKRRYAFPVYPIDALVQVTNPNPNVVNGRVNVQNEARMQEYMDQFKDNGVNEFCFHVTFPGNVFPIVPIVPEGAIVEVVRLED